MRKIKLHEDLFAINGLYFYSNISKAFCRENQ